MRQEEIINLVVNEYGFELQDKDRNSAIFRKDIADPDFGNEYYLQAKYYLNISGYLAFEVNKIKVTVEKNQMSWERLSEDSIRKSIEENPAYALLADAERIAKENDKWNSEYSEELMKLL